MWCFHFGSDFVLITPFILPPFRVKMRSKRGKKHVIFPLKGGKYKLGNQNKIRPKMKKSQFLFKNKNLERKMFWVKNVCPWIYMIIYPILTALKALECAKSHLFNVFYVAFFSTNLRQNMMEIFSYLKFVILIVVQNAFFH